MGELRGLRCDSLMWQLPPTPSSSILTVTNRSKDAVLQDGPHASGWPAREGVWFALAATTWETGCSSEMDKRGAQ